MEENRICFFEENSFNTKSERIDWSDLVFSCLDNVAVGREIWPVMLPILSFKE